jgi:hypothetical protein
MHAPAKLEIVFSRDGAVWHVRVRGWPAPYVRRGLDDFGGPFPVREPDLEDLANFMRRLEAPYVQAAMTLGGVAIEGSGQSAVALWEWLGTYLLGA